MFVALEDVLEVGGMFAARFVTPSTVSAFRIQLYRNFSAATTFQTVRVDTETIFFGTVILRAIMDLMQEQMDAHRALQMFSMRHCPWGMRRLRNDVAELE
ncbi:unnamed protein product [Toxocara canis]|uniref:Uncharacterized protein n=1 Tax=Toxocara canis TaxID=6265 RepID=A0A183UYX6_TOXCA|nr:unnamed protein product [Toxocara canis]